jgi:amino acid adenylation domain-containing protein/non-ribosomal peptide synthase protein (TIGR01720 family)
MIDEQATPISSDAQDELLSLLLDEAGVEAIPSDEIPVIDKTGHSPLSFAQERLWFLEQLQPGGAVYNIPYALRFSGQLDVDALCEALNDLVRRHDSLHTIFRTIDERPVQIVQPPRSTHAVKHAVRTVDLPVIDLRDRSAVDQSTEVQRLTLESAERAFDLTRGPLLRAQLLRLADQEYDLLLTLHHIIFDGWSSDIFFREWAALYAARVEGNAPSLTELPIQYADFTAWQRQWLEGTVLDQQLDYWRQHLKGELPVLQLPTDHVRPPTPSSRGATYYFRLPHALSDQIAALSQQTGVTLFMILLAAFQALLYRYTGQIDLLIGTPIANRQRRELENLIGFFVNTLVVRVDMSGEPTFRELLKRVRETALDAYANQDVPFEKLVNALQPNRDLDQQPLFQVMFALQQSAFDQIEWPQLRVTSRPLDTHTAKFDLTLVLEEDALGLSGSLEYRTELFEADTIARLAGHFQTLLAGIAAQPDRSVVTLPLLTEAEQQQLLIDWNATQADYPRDKCVQQLIEEQAQRAPEAVAAVYRDQRLTYGELNARANQLAHYLITQGIKPDDLVCVYMERRPEMFVALLAVLKAGAAYVPIDPALPVARLTFIVQDARAKVVLTEEALVTGLQGQAVTALCIDCDWDLIISRSTGNPITRARPHNLAYVIYTSGSTGAPKGVQIQHSSLMNLVTWHQRTFEITSHDRATHLAGLGFDASAWELWPYLAAGASLYLAEDETRLAPDRLRDWLVAEQITISFLPTPLAESVLKLAWPDTTACRWLLTGGDRLHTYPTAATPFKLSNNYGPTENTVVTTSGLVQPIEEADTPPSIGKPIDNVCAYVLDPHLQLVPIGVPGELHIGGEGLARGYLNQPELTAEKFIHDPFSLEANARLYKTSDLVRYLPDGQLEYLGRLDYQVKVRGFRIELGEIEAAIGQHPSVQDAVVIAWDMAGYAGRKQLVAYVVRQQRAVLSAHELRDFLRDTLPDYMLPAACVFLDSFPLTPNGKVDRKRLPAPISPQPEVEQPPYTAPRTPAERILAGIWEEMLQTEHIGIDDNFFELGGDSILSIQIIARANRRGLRLSPRQIFQYQTIAELAAAVDTDSPIKAEQGEVTGSAPLTPIQCWFFEKNFDQRQHWNQAMLLKTQQPLKINALQQALQQLMRQHDVLRLRFNQTPAGWTQDHAPADAAPFRWIDLSARSVAATEQQASIESAAAQMQASLDLMNGPLWRAAYFDLGPHKSGRLLIVIHHLAVDGVSWRILLEDLQTAYEQIDRGEAVALPPKTTSFKAWAEQLIEYANSATLKHESSYWLNEPWSQAAPLPVDRPIDQADLTEGAAQSLKVSLSAAATRALLQDVPPVYRTQINDVLLTALAQTFAPWMQSDHLLIDLEAHGREEIVTGIDLSRTVGWFTSLFPVLLVLDPSAQPGEAIQLIKDQLRRIPKRGIGFGMLRYLSSDAALIKKLQALPKAQVSFNYLGQFDQVFSDSALFAPAPESSGPPIAPTARRHHMIEILARIVHSELQIEWMYSPQVLDRRSIEQLAHSFMAALQNLIEHCQTIEAGGYIPSDFSLVKLDQALLDRLHADYPPLEDIYPLSPGQQEMLRYLSPQPHTAVYVVQWHSILNGPLNGAAFKRAWQQVVDRYAILRTAFRWEELPAPIQLVQRTAELNWSQNDRRGYSPEAQANEVNLFLQADRARGFDVRHAPLMRFTLIQVADTTYHFVWTHSHLLLDGWSMAPIWKAVWSAYRAAMQGHELQLEPPRLYREYVAWAQQQDRSQAEGYWRKALAGFTAPTSIAPQGQAAESNEAAQFDEQQLQLPNDLTQRLRTFAQRNYVTLNTCWQGAWALLLSRYSDQADVLFGIASAGRPAALPGVEEMVGMFVNPLPLRVQIDRAQLLGDWLQKLQVQQVEMAQYEYNPLSLIQTWSSVPPDAPLFESFLRFQNYPPMFSPDEGKPDVQIENVETMDWWQYPLSLIVVPEAEISVFILYQRHRFAAAVIDRVLKNLQTLLARFVNEPEARLGELIDLIEM